MAHRKSSATTHAAPRSARRAETHAAPEQAAPETPSARRKRTALPAEERRTFPPAPMLSPAAPTSAHPGTARGVMDPDADWASGAADDAPGASPEHPTPTSDEE